MGLVPLIVMCDISLNCMSLIHCKIVNGPKTTLDGFSHCGDFN